MKNNRKFSSRTASSRRHQGGWSILQVLLGLVVLGVFVTVAVDQYQSSNRKGRIEGATQEFIDIAGTAQKNYGQSNQYGSVTTAIAIQGGVVPLKRRNKGTNTANNIYNGAITFAPATINTANDGLSITYANVTGSDCQQLVQNTSNLARQIFIGATQVMPTDGDVNLATLSTTCDATAAVDVRWVIGRS